MNNQYEVLSPWAEADPIPLHGISPRLTDLADKKIGLFATAKRASKPILTVFEQKLKERYPSCETSWWVGEGAYTVLQTVGPRAAEFKEWVKGVDAVVAAIGD